MLHISARREYKSKHSELFKGRMFTFVHCRQHNIAGRINLRFGDREWRRDAQTFWRKKEPICQHSIADTGVDDPLVEVEAVELYGNQQAAAANRADSRVDKPLPEQSLFPLYFADPLLLQQYLMGEIKIILIDKAPVETLSFLVERTIAVVW